MIVWEGKGPNAIHWQGKDIVAVYTDSKLVWEMFLSCFGRGYWINDLPWVNTDVWNNNV